MREGKSKSQLLQSWKKSQYMDQHLLTTLDLQMQVGQALPSGKNAIQGHELQISPPRIPLGTFNLQTGKWGEIKVPKGAKIIGVILEIGARRHIHSSNNVGMVWEYDRGLLKVRENPLSHPLDRNTLQIQGMEGLG